MQVALKDALRTVEEKLRSYESGDTKLKVDEDYIDAEGYWVFFYNSEAFFKTGDFSCIVLGNAPFIIDKYEGGVYYTGTAHSIEYYMELFERIELPVIKSRITR